MTDALERKVIRLNDEIRDEFISILMQYLRADNLTLDQWVLLITVNRNPGINQKNLAQIVRKDRPSVTRILDGLEKKQLIIRKREEKDRRAFLLYVTDTGLGLLDKLNGCTEKIFIQIFNEIPKEELEVMISIFEKMKANIVLMQQKQVNIHEQD
ncbi:MarR family winged helix-turn-helix transcriptional regulator [Bacillus paramycoides]|uniref:MarR family winged helix-turn-helix transcriptional regulator n=1 Tax=Bacillus paramycoides TaxID=2026194 RepID=UPI003CFD38CF